MTSNKLLMPLLTGADDAPNLDNGDHGKPGRTSGTTVTQTTFNLTKNIVGAGVLSLPFGVAAGTGLIPAIVTTIWLGLYSAWTFTKLGEMCDQYDARTFTELGEKVSGKGFAKLMALTCTTKTFFSCFVYSLVISDSWTQILVGFGCDVVREQVLPGMTALVLLPLCLMENLSFLAYTSLVGSGGIVFTLCFMIQRFYDESYLPGGQFYDSVPAYLHPNFQDAPDAFEVENLKLISLLSTAFIAHYNAPKFYEQLADRSPERFNNVSRVSFTIAILVFAAFMVIGYLTFGINSQGNILNNYSSDDPLATAARLAISISVVLTYPLAFTGLRDGTAEFLGDVNKTLLTIGLLTLITGLGFVVQDVGLVNAIQGAILGSGIIYGFPGMILVYAEKRQSPKEIGWLSAVMSRLTVLLGFALGLHGASLTVLPMILEM